MPEPIVLEALTDALADVIDFGDHELISLVGGGGKTTLLFALGAQLGGRRVLTTTTKMGTDRTGGRRLLIDPDDRELAAALGDDGVVLVWGSAEGHRAGGVTPATCDRWFDRVDHVLVEADGSRRRPFKAPLDHEPVVPKATTVLIACVGAAAFDAVIAESCHRPERVAALAGCAVTDRLDAARLAAVLESPSGSRKGCPVGARFVVVANQVAEDDLAFLAALRETLDPGIPLVAVAREG